MLWKLAARDTAILATATLAWAGTAAWWTATAGVIAAIGGVVWGFLLGFSANYAAHEWGHLAGAVAGGGAVQIRPVRSLQLFRLQPVERGPFLWMSAGGNVAPWLVTVALLLTVFPEGPAERTLLGTAVGGIVFTNAIELPIVWRAASRGDTTIRLRRPHVLTSLALGVLAGFAIALSLG